MTSRRNKLLLKMLETTTGETEEKLLKLSIERIVADQAEYYKKFYKNEGAGAMVFMPQKKDKDSMFYLTVDLLIKAVNDANNKELGGVEHLRKAISIAESLDPEKEALFILQDKDDIQLFHFKTDEKNPSLLQM
jgi:penicillin-binding protein-related factor A (putative recombinase)